MKIVQEYHLEIKNMAHSIFMLFPLDTKGIANYLLTTDLMQPYAARPGKMCVVPFHLACVVVYYSSKLAREETGFGDEIRIKTNSKAI